MSNCENCGKEHNGEYGSGRFCSEGCSKSYSTKARRAEINERVSKTLKIVIKKKCRCCKEEFIAKRKDRVYCSNKCRARDMKEKTKKKLSFRAKQTVLDGTHEGWETRKVRSYAERFFEEVLKKNGIEFVPGHRMERPGAGDGTARYYLFDFYIERYRIDLEIDGKQRGYSGAREEDATRDAELKRYGILVYRVRWVSPRTKEGMERIRGEVDSFLEFYGKMARWHEARTENKK